MSRLYTEQGWRDNPAYRDTEICRPLVIIGIPRTGQTHRNPVEAIPSLCSVLHMTRRISSGEATDLTLLGPRELKVSGDGIERVMKVRERHKDQVIDVLHRDFHANPMHSVHRIYERFGFKLTAATEARMNEWIATNPAGKHGEHRYSPGQFGLNEPMIRRRFKGYMEAFNLSD